MNWKKLKSECKWINKVISKIYKVNLNLKTSDIKIGKNVYLRGDIELNTGVYIGDNCKIDGEILLRNGVTIKHNSNLNGTIKIEDMSNLGFNNEVIGNIKIGKYCAIARNVTFQGQDHFMKKPAIQMGFYSNILNENLEAVSKGPIKVGHDVWIGTQSLILSGVNIGNGAIVGGGSIVTNDVEPYSVVVGVPAEHKKY